MARLLHALRCPQPLTFFVVGCDGLGMEQESRAAESFRICISSCLTSLAPIHLAPPHPQVRDISIQAYEVALKQISDNREAIDRITEALLEKETLTGEEFRTMLAK